MNFEKNRFSLLAAAALLLHCGIFEPKVEKGILILVLPSGMQGEPGTEPEDLGAAEYDLRRSSVSVRRGSLTKTGDHFRGIIQELTAGEGYSVAVEGRGNDGALAALAYRDSIRIGADETLTITPEWARFEPVPLGPPNGWIGVPTQPTFFWTAVEVPCSVELQVSEDSDFSTLAAQRGGITGSSASIGPILAGQTYYWRVRRILEEDTSHWSAVRCFTTAAVRPQAPVLLAPPNGYPAATECTIFSWNPVEGADFYRLQISTHYSFDRVVFDCTRITESFKPVCGIAEGTTYYWRVIAEGVGGASEWSRYWYFSRSAAEETVTDLDGNTYHPVTIGSQVWMVENLNTTHFRNGDAIPNVTDGAKWCGLTTGAYCDYGNDPTRSAVYGRLYNWFAVDDPRGIAPEGWHVPSEEEWRMLVDFLGGPAVAGIKMKESGPAHWGSGNWEARNSSGFTALPGGYRGGIAAAEYDLCGTIAAFWTSTESAPEDARYIHLYSDVLSSISGKQNGCSVRLVRD